MRPNSIAREPEVFGDSFVDHFGGTRENEVKLWNTAVTDWEGEPTSTRFCDRLNHGISRALLRISVSGHLTDNVLSSSVDTQQVIGDQWCFEKM